ncbi:hypothetical protein HID58_058524 [Brassica napus]|uniref:Uncharacterized protein n=1 Tax=Brassica napus TaxID=3708 RepID=A0ABQ7ZQY2_BRANA|nr:hypothetical protein HID58_058524 [Brassica napus]
MNEEESTSQLSNTSRDNGSSSSRSSRGGVTNKREQPRISRLLLIQEQIIRNPKRAVQANNRHSNGQRRSQQRSNARHKHNHDRRHHEPEQSLAIREAAPEDNQRLIRRPEEVEEHPRAEEREEDEEREGVREEGEGED